MQPCKPFTIQVGLTIKNASQLCSPQLHLAAMCFIRPPPPQLLLKRPRITPAQPSILLFLLPAPLSLSLQWMFQPPSPAFQYQTTLLSCYIQIWQGIPGHPDSILALWHNLNHHHYLNFWATSQGVIEEFVILRSFCKGHYFPCWKNYAYQCCYWYARFHQLAYWHFWEIHDETSCRRPCHYLSKSRDGIGAGVWQ